MLHLTPLGSLRDMWFDLQVKCTSMNIRNKEHI